MSEDFGSEDLTNGEQEEMDGSQKSPAPGEKSPGQQSSSSSAHADDEGDSPSSSGGDISTTGDGTTGTTTARGGGGAEVVVVRPTPCTPQQFMRLARDLDSTCARTDLVYVHPPPAEKEMATSTTKVR